MNDLITVSLGAFYVVSSGTAVDPVSSCDELVLPCDRECCEHILSVYGFLGGGGCGVVYVGSMPIPKCEDGDSPCDLSGMVLQKSLPQSLCNNPWAGDFPNSITI